MRPPPPHERPPRPPPPKPPLPSPSHDVYVYHIEKSGEDALWVAYAIFVLTTLFLAILANRLHVKHRALHLIALVVSGVAALSYFAMATHSGVSYVSRGFKVIDGEEKLVLRQVFWARYIHWLITTPPLYLAFSLIAGYPWVDVILLILDVFAALFCAIFGALLNGRETVRWAWYGHACFFVLLILAILFGKGRQCANQQHAHVNRLYMAIAFFIIFIAIFWTTMLALGEGTGTIDVNTEVIVYAIFDILTRSVLPIWFAVGYKFDKDEEHVTCFSDAWTRVRGKGGAIRLENDH